MFATMPGLTVESLRRIVGCHLARNAELGFDQQENEFCPLNVRGGSAFVRPVHDGVAVEVTSTDGAAALEIARRVLALAPVVSDLAHRRCCP